MRYRQKRQRNWDWLFVVGLIVAACLAYKLVGGEEPPVVVGISDHEFMGYLQGAGKSRPTYFMWGGQAILEVSTGGVVVRYKKDGVWKAAQ